MQSLCKEIFLPLALLQHCGAPSGYMHVQLKPAVCNNIQCAVPPLLQKCTPSKLATLPADATVLCN